MKSISYQNFFHSHFDDLPLHEDVLFGKIFLPEKHHHLIEEAKNCDLKAVEQLKDMFIYGKKGTTANFEVAKRYWYALHGVAEVSCCKISISLSLDEYANILEIFKRPLIEQAEAYAFAISYTTSELTTDNWGISVLQKQLARLEEIQDILNQ